MDLILILVIIFLPTLANLYIKINYNKCLKINLKKDLTGFDIARKILDKNGLQDVYIVKTSGTLTDHYDPKRKTIRLSGSIYDGTSVASASVAAHEVGHAIQDKEGYLFLKLRSFMFPIINITSSLAYYIILFGFLFELMDLAKIGIIFIAGGLLFQIITLPVEFNASKKARNEFISSKLLNKYEIDLAKSMLLSAALTYVAGTLASALQLLRLIGMIDRD